MCSIVESSHRVKSVSTLFSKNHLNCTGTGSSSEEVKNTSKVKEAEGSTNTSL